MLRFEKEGVPWQERVTFFDDRTLLVLKNRYKILASGNFTSEEDQLLLELEDMYVPWQERVMLFNNRTLDILQKRLKVLKSKPAPSGKFTSEDDDLIVNAIESGTPVEEISQLLERTMASVKKRIKKLRELQRLDPTPPMTLGSWYTAAELELVGEMIERGRSWGDVTTEHFPGRNIGSVKMAYGRYLARKRKEEEEEGEQE